jgi:hypothetical protein
MGSRYPNIQPKNAVRCFASKGIKSETMRLGKTRIEVRLNESLFQKVGVE